MNVTREELSEAFAQVRGARKQEALLLAMLEMSGFQRGGAGEVKRAALLERAGVSPLDSVGIGEKGDSKVI